MEQSLFLDLVQKWMPTYSAKVTEYINGKREAPEYLYRRFLTPELSPTMTWESLIENRSIVAAAVVAFDSEIPLFRRDSFGYANGTLPKLGMKFWKGEKDIKNLMIIRNNPNSKESDLVAKLFNDAGKASIGIEEQIENMFLQAFSTGITEIADSDNAGVSIRVDFGYKDDNKYTASIKWGNAGYTPITDIKNVIAKSDKSFTTIALSKKTYDLIRNSQEAKDLSANFRGLVITTAADRPVPTPSQFNEAFSDELGISFLIVDRRVQVEIDGQRKYVRPFNQDNLVFFNGTSLGRLVHSTLAEEEAPVSGVVYSKTTAYTLLSMFRKNEPLREWTSSQAIALPVIEGVDDICLLDSSEASDDTQTEGDANIAIDGVSYTRVSVIAALVDEVKPASTANTDAQLLVMYNSLSTARKNAVKAKFVTA